MGTVSLPVACSLTDAELRERRGSVLQKVRGAVVEVREVDEGYAYRFHSEGALIPDLANLIMLEHQCCPFLHFRLTVEPGSGPVWLEMTGPQGTKEFLASIFN